MSTRVSVYFFNIGEVTREPENEFPDYAQDYLLDYLMQHHVHDFSKALPISDGRPRVVLFDMSDGTTALHECFMLQEVMARAYTQLHNLSGMVINEESIKQFMIYYLVFYAALSRCGERPEDLVAILESFSGLTFYVAKD